MADLKGKTDQEREDGRERGRGRGEGGENKVKGDTKINRYIQQQIFRLFGFP